MNQTKQQFKPGHHTVLEGPAQVERFGLISEELGESTQAVGKIFRHGFGAVDPMGNYYDNKTQLEKELGDIIAASILSACAGEVSLSNIVVYAINKARKIVDGEAFLHHQPQELLERVAVAIGDLNDLHSALEEGEHRAAAMAHTFCKMYGVNPDEAQKAAADPQRRRVMIIALGNRASPAADELADIVQRFQTAEVDPLGASLARPQGKAEQKAADVQRATMHEINAVVKSCIEDCDFMYPVRSGTKRFEKLLNMLRDEYGQNIVFDFPKRRDFHRAIDLQNWAVHCLVQNSLDMGTST